MKIGIDKIGFYAPSMYLDMVDLANARGVEPEKFTIGLGQEEMAVPPLYEDAVTMAANAALSILEDIDKEKIDLILVGTESGIDNSKSIAVYMHSLVGLSSCVRAVELKQACYGATMALQLAKGHILQNPESKVLVIATDIAKYGLNTPGEATQGAGAVAMLVSKNPRIAILNQENTYLTEDIMDFWRPVYSSTAFADGKFSTEKYLYFFETIFKEYCEKTKETVADFKAICFHQPFTKLGLKALKLVLDGIEEDKKEALLALYNSSKTYNKRIGNIYTGSLYLGLLSLLEQNNTLYAGDKIGLFSYGSGAVGEFFTITLVKDFENYLYTDKHIALLENRQRLTINEYEAIFSTSLPEEDATYYIENVPNDRVVLCGKQDHKRIYKKNEVL
ncbi:hydroxymethylglutaryl-CoA synthase [Carnobacteriaceae bacterium zg-ZUI78]|nr:hydroxymethylglutaryl-CoA synthase [Carnobacteriaceae bacterium zg-ZUI78]